MEYNQDNESVKSSYSFNSENSSFINNEDLSESDYSPDEYGLSSVSSRLPSFPYPYPPVQNNFDGIKKSPSSQFLQRVSPLPSSESVNINNNNNLSPTPVHQVPSDLSSGAYSERRKSIIVERPNQSNLPRVTIKKTCFLKKYFFFFLIYKKKLIKKEQQLLNH